MNCFVVLFGCKRVDRSIFLYEARYITIKITEDCIQFLHYTQISVVPNLSTFCLSD